MQNARPVPHLSSCVDSVVIVWALSHCGFHYHCQCQMGRKLSVQVGGGSRHTSLISNNHQHYLLIVCTFCVVGSPILIVKIITIMHKSFSCTIKSSLRPLMPSANAWDQNKRVPFVLIPNLVEAVTVDHRLIIWEQFFFFLILQGLYSILRIIPDLDLPTKHLSMKNQEVQRYILSW